MVTYRLPHLLQPGHVVEVLEVNNPAYSAFIGARVIITGDAAPFTALSPLDGTKTFPADCISEFALVLHPSMSNSLVQLDMYADTLEFMPLYNSRHEHHVMKLELFSEHAVILTPAQVLEVRDYLTEILQEWGNK